MPFSTKGQNRSFMETMTMQIAESKNEQARDKIEAMLRRLYVDLFLYGPSQFLTRY